MRCPILIHVGYHKTATSWLQNQLFQCESLGYVTPWGAQSGQAVDVFVNGNPFRFDPAAARAVFADGMAEAAGRSLLPVLSNEAMCGSEAPRMRYEREVADRLHETFPEARILITIRNQKEAIFSHYRQNLMRGGSDTIRQFLGENTLRPGFSPRCQLDHFEYDLFVGHYFQLFAKDRVLVLPQEQLQSDRQAFADQLSQFVGLSGGPAPDAPAERVGWRGASLTFRRFCNRFGLGRPDWSRPRQSLEFRLINKLGRVIGRHMPAVVNRRLEAEIRSFIDTRVGDYFVSSNHRLERMTGLDLRRFRYDLPELGELSRDHPSQFRAEEK